MDIYLPFLSGDEPLLRGYSPKDQGIAVWILGGNSIQISKTASAYKVGYPSLLSALPRWGNRKGIWATRKGYLSKGAHPRNFAANAVFWL
jgi:hypothetical protein